jgi:hypothetical protein
VGNYRSVSTARVWLRWTVSVVSLAWMLTAVGFALVWVPRKLLGRLRDARHLSVRVFPVIAVVTLAVAFDVMLLSMDDPLPKLGRPTVWSVGFYLLTLLFAAAALAGFVQAVRARNWEIRRGVWLHALLVSLANVVVLLYLGYWGVIGLRPWSY